MSSPEPYLPCHANAEQSAFSALDFLRNVAKVLRHSQVEISECLSVHPDLRLAIVSSLLPPPNNNIPTPPPDTEAVVSVADRGLASNGAALGVVVTDSVVGVNDRTTHVSRKRKRDDTSTTPETTVQESDSEKVRKRAIAVINDAIHNLLPHGVYQLRRTLLNLRDEPGDSTPRKPYKMLTYTRASKQDVITHILGFKEHFEELRSSTRCETLIDRVQHALTAEHHSQCHQANTAHRIVGGSLYVFFTEIWWEDWVKKLEASQTPRETQHEAKQQKWRDKVKTGRRWWKFHERYGVAFLAILPETVKDTNVSKPLDSDLEAIFAKIDREYPNLKEELQELSKFIWDFVTRGELPRERLLLETLCEQDVVNMLPGGLGKLLRFVGTPPLPSDDERREAKEDMPVQGGPSHSNGDMVHVTDEPNIGASFSLPPSNECYDWNADLANYMMPMDEQFTVTLSHDELDRIGVVDVQDTAVAASSLSGNIEGITDGCIDPDLLVQEVGMSVAGQYGVSLWESSGSA